MSLKMILIESATLQFNQQVTRQNIAEKQIRAPAIDDHLPADEGQARLDEQIWAVGNRFFHLLFEHEATLKSMD